MDMTRFLLSLNQAVDTIFAAVADAKRGETYIPRVPSSKVVDIADALIGDRKIKKVVTGIRPGEKVHEILVSEEEANRTIDKGRFYAIQPILPEISKLKPGALTLKKEYSSADNLMSEKEVTALLKKNKMMVGDRLEEEGEMLG
jgi:UDP-glucose 4-epimerase